jgi:hypothetical protein
MIFIVFCLASKAGLIRKLPKEKRKQVTSMHDPDNYEAACAWIQSLADQLNANSMQLSDVLSAVTIMKATPPGSRYR